MAVPTVTGLDPASGPEGTQVIIVGTGFTEDTSRIRFGTYDCQLNYTVISDTAISAIAPAGSGTVYVLVTNPDGSNATGAQFTFSAYVGGANSVPTVTALSDHTAPGYDGEGGEAMTITGTGFDSAIAVYFGPTLATAAQVGFVKVSPTSITCTTPRGEPGTTSYVFVENSYGVSVDADSDNAYAYQTSAVPTVSSLTPATALPGMDVTITGTNFTIATEVRVGTLSAQFTIFSDTTITLTVPGDATFLGSTAEVYVSNFWGESTTHATLTYATAGTLRTTLTLSTGTPAQSPRDGWIVTGSSITCTLAATYTPWSAETYIESKWYRLDAGANTKYTGTFTVSGEGSHKVEFWAVGKDGIIEATNVRYVNIVASVTPTLTATAGISQISFSWTAINIPGCYYTLYYGAANPPTTNPTTLSGCSYLYMIAPGTNVYARVRVYGPDGTDYGYSNVTGPTQSSGIQASDLANDSITNAKLAPSLKPPPIFTTANEPALPNATYPVGSYYYNSTTDKLRINAANVWTDSSAQALAVIGQVVAGTVEAGAIGATEIAADSVYAKHLIVADYENLVQNGSSELALAPGLSYPVAYDSAEIEFRGVINTNANRGNNCRRITGNTTAVYLTLCDPVPAKAGDVFRISVKSKVGSTGTAQVAIAGVNASGSDVATPTASTGTTSTSYQSDGPPILYDYVEYTVPTGSGASAVVAVRAYLMYTGAAATYGYFDDILFRKMVAGSLIVDGAITGTKITANVALDAPVITGGTITGATVNVESHLYLGTNNNSGIITLQNGTGGKYGMLESAVAGAGQERIEISSGAAGYVKLDNGHSGHYLPQIYVLGDFDDEGNMESHVNVEGPCYDSYSRPFVKLYAGEGTHVKKGILLESPDTSGGHVTQVALDGYAHTLSQHADNIHIHGATGVEVEGPFSAKNPLTGMGIVTGAGTAINFDYDFQHRSEMFAVDKHPEFYVTTTGSGGTAAGYDGGVAHPGAVSFTSANVANSGQTFGYGQTFAPASGDSFDCVFRVPANSASTHIKFGVMNNLSVTDPTAGAFFEIVGTSLYGRAGAGTLQTTSAWSYSTGTWYRAVIDVASDRANFVVYLCSDGSVAMSSRTTGTLVFPGGPCYYGFSYWIGSVAAAQNMLIMDYMGLHLVPRTR